MKLKFILVPLAVLGFVVGSYADDVTWVTPSDNVCVSNGGKIDEKGICEANWENAKNICYSSGGKLPTMSELNQVLIDCKGISVDSSSLNKPMSKNIKNEYYQSCYKKQGFVNFEDYDYTSFYWSSTVHPSVSSLAYEIQFYYGLWGSQPMSYEHYVRCVKSKN